MRALEAAAPVKPATLANTGAQAALQLGQSKFGVHKGTGAGVVWCISRQLSFAAMQPVALSRRHRLVCFTREVSESASSWCSAAYDGGHTLQVTRQSLQPPECAVVKMYAWCHSAQMSDCCTIYTLRTAYCVLRTAYCTRTLQNTICTRAAKDSARQLRTQCDNLGIVDMRHYARGALGTRLLLYNEHHFTASLYHARLLRSFANARTLKRNTLS